MTAYALNDMLREVGGTFTVVVTMVAILAAAYAASKQGLIKTLTEDNAALRAGRQDDKAALAEARLVHEQQAHTITEQGGQVTLLREINSQIVNWTAVVDLVGHHNQMAEARWTTEDELWQARQTIEDQSNHEQTLLLREILAALKGSGGPRPSGSSRPSAR